MWIEYAATNKNTTGNTFVYGFADWEKKVLIKGIPSEIKKLQTKIRKIENNPRNEGQVKYWSKIRELQLMIDSLKEIQETFNK